MRTRSVIPAAVLLFGCRLHHRAAAPEPIRGPARDSLLQFDRARGDSAATRGPTEAILSVLSPDIVYLRAGVPPIYGLEGVRALLSAGTAEAVTSIGWQPVGGGVSDDLRSGYTYGVTARVARRGSSISFDRYVAYWQRAGAQPWRILAYAEVDAPAATEATLSADMITPPARTLSKAMAEATARVMAADSAFADLGYRMGTAHAFSSTATSDGVVLTPSYFAVGPEAIRSFFSSQARDGSLSWRPVFGVVAGSRDLGFTIGEYISTGRGTSGAVVQRFGKYLTVWKRQANGSWKFVVDGGNPTPTRDSQK
jgi:ketosteroid isomerase-like protein